MAMQTPVLSISIQDMCLSDVISMSRDKKLEISYIINYHDINIYVTIYHMIYWSNSCLECLCSFTWMHPFIIAKTIV